MLQMELLNDVRSTFFFFIYQQYASCWLFNAAKLHSFDFLFYQENFPTTKHQRFVVDLFLFHHE